MVYALEFAAIQYTEMDIFGGAIGDGVTGNSAKTFNPEGALTRAQAVKVLNRLFECPTLE